MSRLNRLPLVVLVFSCASTLGQDTIRQLPPGDYLPRTRAEWQAEMDRRDSLTGPSFKDAFPKYAGHFDAMMERVKSLPGIYMAGALVYDTTLADQLVSELYVDVGHPILNKVAQDYVVNPVISDVARWPAERLPLAARQRLTEGLMAYVAVGGGQYSPASQADVADTLDELAPNDATVQRTVEELLEDALAWAEEVNSDIQRKSVYRRCVKHWGDAFWLSMYEMGLKDSALPSERPKRYEKAVAALAGLLSEPPGEAAAFAKRVRTATEAALTGFKDRRFTDDLTCRLLIVYRHLLARRPMVAEKLVRYIDDRLLWLAVKSDRLTTKQHWRLWTEAVAALRPTRVSERIKSYVRTLLKTKDLPELRRNAAERLRFLVLE